MKSLISLLFCINFLFALNPNISAMNSLKEVIQKEEYIALSINKYILQTGKIPKKSDDTLDWDLLMVDDYLGVNFNKKNPLTSKDMIVKFDTSNNCFMLGVIEKKEDYNSNHNFLYNFYTQKEFRVNSLGPKSIDKLELEKGAQVLYSNTQKQIAALLKESKEVRVDSEACPIGNYYYELKNNSLEYRYCKSDHSFAVYQTSPIFLEDADDLPFIKGKIGDRAYAKKNGIWYEYYFQGDVSNSWIPVSNGSVLTSQDETADIEDRIISYIPDSKDLVLREDGGCMLANGDIFCWGNNVNKKTGIENYGQLDPNITPAFTNTPIMLKVQIDDSDDSKINGVSRRDKRWYNNPYRIKFEKMAVNDASVCGISPIFDYFQSGTYKKFGGDLYCNGGINQTYFDSLITATSSQQDKDAKSILRRNSFFNTSKDDKLNNANEIYLKDVSMVDGIVAILSDTGKIYTFGTNTKGALGIGSNDETTVVNPTNLTSINTSSDQVFTKIFALRNLKCFGAIDNNNEFWMWGERNDYFINIPTKVSSFAFDEDRIFVNSTDFVLRSLSNEYYRTYDDGSSVNAKKITEVPSSALSVAIYDNGSTQEYLYISEKRQLFGTSSLKSCLSTSGSACGTSDSNIFNLSFNDLNNILSGEEYANFSNVAIFGKDNLESTPDPIEDDFESGDTTGWGTSGDSTEPPTIEQGNVDTGPFLTHELTEDITVSKTYSFGVSQANKEIQLDFDFYEIGQWSNDSFTLSLNNTTIFTKTYQKNKTEDDVTSTGTLNGENLKIHGLSTTGTTVTLDSSGNLKMDFSFDIKKNKNQSKAWGIDNLKISIITSGSGGGGSGGGGSSSGSTEQKFVCAMTGLGSSSQMYCWGNVGRALPIVSTSLYDISKISNMNNLFVSQAADEKTQMSFDEFNNNGSLFLKYPTYIGGFDYEFYFK